MILPSDSHTSQTASRHLTVLFNDVSSVAVCPSGIPRLYNSSSQRDSPASKNNALTAISMQSPRL